MGWTTDPKRGCKNSAKKKKNTYTLTGDSYIAKLIDGKGRGWGDFYKNTGSKEEIETYMPLSTSPDATCGEVTDVTKMSTKEEIKKRETKCKAATGSSSNSLRLDIKPESGGMTDTVIAFSSCNQKHGCQIFNKKEGKLAYVRFRIIMCLVKANIMFGVCNTCCCKGGMVQYKVSVSLLHKTSGYSCAKQHTL